MKTGRSPAPRASTSRFGAKIGARAGSYWEVPVIENLSGQPGSDDLKHLGAAMASFGSIPLFHAVGITPEAPTLESVCDPDGLAAFIDEMRRAIRPPSTLEEVDAHINDQAFADAALAVFDRWRADGTISA